MTDDEREEGNGNAGTSSGEGGHTDDERDDDDERVRVGEQESGSGGYETIDPETEESNRTGESDKNGPGRPDNLSEEEDSDPEGGDRPEHEQDADTRDSGDSTDTQESHGEADSESRERDSGDVTDERVASLESEIANMKTELERSRERIDKLETELEDYERRNDHEHEELRKYAVEDFAREMLQVKDMLGDAIEMEDLESGTERRLQMVKKQFDKVLTSGRIERIEPEERDPYDDKHHRMEDKVPTEEYEPDHVVRVIEVGYRASDRVIRPARVEVAAPKEE